MKNCDCIGHRVMISPNDCVCSPDDAQDLSKCKSKEFIEYMDKQRTKLLARVREEVIGKDEEGKLPKTISEKTLFAEELKVLRNLLRKEQLKKLEIISEEGK